MIPYIIKNIRDIIITLNKLGIAIINAYIPILSPLFLLITLRGLKTLISLNILNIFNLALVIIMDIIDIKTTKKSIIFHPF